MTETPDTPGEIPAETPTESSPAAKRRIKMIVGGAVTFILAALIAVAVLFSSSKSGGECDAWLKAKADYLNQVPPIQIETQSDAIEFDGKVSVGGKTFTRPDSCK